MLTMCASLSEYGCTENRPRDFGELSALMNTNQMTPVYSGGLMYEYSNEGNDYGIVQLKGLSVIIKDEYRKLKMALTKNPIPSGDGGATKKSHAVSCPLPDPEWQVNSAFLPDMPDQAITYLKRGASPGPGLTGKGSQTAGDSGTSPGSYSAVQSTPTPTGAPSDNDQKSSGSSIRLLKGVTFNTIMVGLMVLGGAVLL